MWGARRGLERGLAPPGRGGSRAWGGQAYPSGGSDASEGHSTISGVHHVRRGYEDIERKLLDLGARIEQEPAGAHESPA